MVTNSPRIRRLENDYIQIRSKFDGDLNISITPVGANPPQQYQVIYRVNSLRLDSGNNPIVVNQTVVNVTLPVGYPREKPHAIATDPVFHPNFGSYICIADFWTPAQSLADILVLIGEMLQWKKFNIRSPLNAIAAEWAVEHQSEIPLGDIEIGSTDRPLEILIGESVSVPLLTPNLGEDSSNFISTPSNDDMHQNREI